MSTRPRSASAFAWQVALVMACAATAAQAAGRIVDWQADAPGAPPGWIMERFGNVREASLKLGRDARGVAAQARFDSGDGKRPAASLRYPVPFQPLHAYRVRVELSAPGRVQADVLVRRRAAPYDPMAIRDVTLDAGTQVVEMDATWPVGAVEGDVRVQIRDAEGSVALRRLTVEDLGPVAVGTPPGKPFPATMIGVHVNKLGNHATWPDAGQALIRLWDTGTTWDKLAPTAADFDAFRGPGWKRIDAYLEYVRRNRPDATVLFTLGTPPAWASSAPDAAKCAYGPGTCGAPASIDLWRHYVRTLAQHYKGRIRYWELWNEADYTLFYVGTTSMVELAKAASEELKAVDPQNRLVSPGYTASTGLSGLYGFLREGGARWVDIIGFHWYFQAHPEQLAAPIANVRRLMQAYGAGDKPIWNTEGGPLCARREQGRCVLEDLGADELDALPARALMTMWLNGVEAFAYYTAEGAGGRTLALLSEDWKASTSTAAALKRFAEWMVGARATGVTRFGRAGLAVHCERDGRRFAVVWSDTPDGEAYTLPAGASARDAQRLVGAAAQMDGPSLTVGRIPVRIAEGG
jgi:hypothetical protein